ncbi:hypothetical protein DFH07DRAFT_16795 [Mycena maculata]|uniref:Uncharacterized protein n=1 Tax=Mycena maculata TaxID=230809 RepID=A0AAD7ILB0_9AGAR|nr:hypothetical protein DFH07DRAFT_16795 [Mycena maculata]
MSTEKLTFLSYLPEFERRTNSSSARGDPKKYALERAAEFITRFGLPEDSDGGIESETRFKEQLYNWFKNTVGRNRRRTEGKPKSARKNVDKATELTRDRRDAWDQDANSGVLTINRNYGHPESSSPTITAGTYSHAENTPAVTPSPTTVAARIPASYSLPSTLANALQPSPSPPPATLAPVTVASLRDSFLTNVDAPILASQIQAFVTSNQSPLSLRPVIFALFQAISTEWDRNNTPPNRFLTSYLRAAAYFTPAVIHAGVSGPLAAATALQMQIRRSAKWTPTSAANVHPNVPSISSGPSSMSLELHRITLDRARRKDHIQWARIHAAALEVGVFTFGYDIHNSDGQGCDYGDTFSNLMAQDCLWEDDEVEWVAGVLVLQALIRTSIRADTGKRRLYENLLINYEERWKEMKDEARQALVTEALLSAKTELAGSGP